ncbi:HNH endonuclease [Rubrivirga marina]|uniref:HNH nuclease domain-containing protein n=1 Tax=Rubrivirga marina TaxID=1196024 RepID=A0A271ISP0_9BACT|nr:HNH endonuclease [Rubrivirga marina]PAP74170.1 hypothetical protein BSZ37_21135 [Rubrivirga marina]
MGTTRNPNWSRDEVILALDLYFAAGRRQLPATDPEVVALSDLLGRLPLHAPSDRLATFRNPTSVSMKLGNLLAVDPEHVGSGLPRGGRVEREVWDDFGGDPDAIGNAADAIRSLVGSDALDLGEDMEEFAEGRLLTRLHRTRERNAGAVRRKKRAMAEQGRLTCETCGFDFSATYGELGDGFIECHHTVPVSSLRPGGGATRLRDLALLCANCHRMIHRSRPMMAVADLRTLIEAIRGTA